MPTAHPPPRHGFTTRSKIVAGVAAVVLAAAGGAALATVGWSGGDEYQTVSYAGDNPFMTPVGTDQPEITPVGAGGSQAGGTPGLYAQDPARPACDAAALIANLQADPAKAAAWAQVLGLAPGSIPAFVDSLTPVVLRANTAVIDHGYRDGTFVARPAVLAPGTAVFINSYGEPTVKCYNGNPLTQGSSSDPKVTVIAPAKSQITTNTFVSLTTGAVLAVPGKPDPKPVPGPNPNPNPRPNPGPNPNPGPGPGPGPGAKVDPALVKAAVLARVEADDAKERAADAATAARIADTGLRESRQRLDNLRSEQQRLIAIANDPTKPLLERLAAQAQLNDNGPNGLSNRIVAAIKDAGAAAQNKDKVDAEKTKADAEAAELDRQAREKEKKAGLPSPPATPQQRDALQPLDQQQPDVAQPDLAQQPGEQQPAEQQPGGEQLAGEAPGGEQLVAGEQQPDGEQVVGGEQQPGEQVAGGEQQAGEQVAGGEQQPGEQAGGEQQPGGQEPGEQAGGELPGEQQPGAQTGGEQQPGPEQPAGGNSQ